MAAGIRRIEAVSGSASLAYSQSLEHQLNEVAATLKAPKSDVVPKLKQLQTRNRELCRQVEQLQAKLAASSGRDLAANAETMGDASVLLQVIDDADAKSIAHADGSTPAEAHRSIIVLAGEKDGKVSLIATVSDSRNEYQGK